jgi:hypothetical protein
MLPDGRTIPVAQNANGVVLTLDSAAVDEYDRVVVLALGRR